MLALLEKRLGNSPADELRSPRPNKKRSPVYVYKVVRVGPITTHGVLDTAVGRPRRGIVVVTRATGPGWRWTELGLSLTNAHGRLTSLLPDAAVLTAGVYRLRFLTDPYFTSHGLQSFYPEIAIHFHVDDPAGHFHVPLLLSPFGYSTYRGS